jgi:outer membrane protein assembly factor BamB
MWNKNLGDIRYEAWAINSRDLIILGSGHNTDSVTVNLELTLLSQQGNRLWKRTYTRTGSISALQVLENDDLMLAGGNWVSLLDNHRYLVWEDTLGYTGTYNNCFISAFGERSAYVLNNQGQHAWLGRYSNDGTALWKTRVSIQQPVISITTEANGNIAVLSGDENTKLDVFGTSGNQIKSIPLFNGLHPQKLLKKPDGSLLLLASKGNYVLLNIATLLAL